MRTLVTALLLVGIFPETLAVRAATTPPRLSIFAGDGSIDRDAYARVARAWDKEAVDARLGPTFASLHPHPGADERPELFKQPSRKGALSWYNRSDPFELGPATGPKPDNDYWSESGQVGYVPDDPEDPGLDRVQVFAYYNYVFALSPRLDLASGKPHPDPQTREKNYLEMLGGKPPRQPIAMVRNYGMLQNEALVIYRDGLLAVAGTETSRAENERPFPGILFPKHKVPSAIAVTTENEFALVTIWDTERLRGQVAVVALEGKYIPFHTWPHMGLPNQGSFSDLKLLGYVDLPIAAPSSISAATNGWWNGPSQTNGQVLSQINLADDGTREGVYKGEQPWALLVATKGYAVIASKLENKAVFLDLEPLMKYSRESYLSSKESFERTIKSRGPGARDWPQTFDVNPEIAPKVAKIVDVSTPTAVLAGFRVNVFTLDVHKAYVASEDGTIHIFNTSSLIARWPHERNEPFAELGSFKVGANPTAMIFTRHLIAPALSILPSHANGQRAGWDEYNNAFYVVCRGTREVVGVGTFGGKAEPFLRIQDKRMNDPVAINVATRGNILSVADFSGKKILSFRIGPITDRFGTFYGAGADGKATVEFAGELGFAGFPFLITSANVN
jgi:hypothetical protein